MDKQPSETKSSDQRRNQVTRDDGNVSPRATPRAGTGPIGGSSSEPAGSAGGDSSPPPPSVGSPKGGGEGGRSMKPLSARGKELPLAGGSSVTAKGSPPPSSENPEGKKAAGGGLERKRKPPPAELPKPCSVCNRPFSSWKALFGHMRTHKDRPWRGVFPPPISPPRQQIHEEQAEELTSSLLNIGREILSEKKRDREDAGSAVAEGGSASSSSVAEARRKDFLLELDLNKKPPEDSDGEGGDENDDA